MPPAQYFDVRYLPPASIDTPAAPPDTPEFESCEQCGGAVKIIASIEDPHVIGRILEHLG